MGQFKINAKKIFLTYSRVDPQLGCEELLNALQAKPFLKRFYYFIAREEHQTEGVHLHAILTRQDHTKFTISNHKQLDVLFNDTVFHGNYQPIRHLAHAIEYSCKGMQYITNMPNFKDGNLYTDKQMLYSAVKEQGKDGNLYTDKQMLYRAVKEQGYAKALLDYTHQNLDNAIPGKSVSTLLKNFKDIKQMQDSLQDDELETFTNLDNFKIEGTLKQWVDNPFLQRNKTLLLVGESGIGKTLFAKTFLQHSKLNTLVVNHKEDFQKIDHVYDAILFDDVNLQHIERTQLLALLDNTVSKTVRVPYNVVRKKKNLVQIVTMSYKALREMQSTLSETAFARRILAYEPKEPFVVNVNNNQFLNFYNTNNVYNHNYSNQHNEPNLFEEYKLKDSQIIQSNEDILDDIAQRE